FWSTARAALSTGSRNNPFRYRCKRENAKYSFLQVNPVDPAAHERVVVEVRSKQHVARHLLLHLVVADLAARLAQVQDFAPELLAADALDVSVELLVRPVVLHPVRRDAVAPLAPEARARTARARAGEQLLAYVGATVVHVRDQVNEADPVLDVI